MAFYYGTGGSSGTYYPPKPPVPPGGYNLGGTMWDPNMPWLSPGQGPTPGLNNYGGTGSATSSQPSRPPMPDLSHLDFSHDPILGRIKALSQESIAQAEADARAERTRLIIGYGSQGLAKKLGLGGQVGKQAKQNPFSTLGELKTAYIRRNIFNDQELSDRGNLFYSTERLRRQALSGEEKLRGQAQAEAAVQERLAAISSQLTQTRMAAQAQQIQAEQDAYNRALQLALYAAGAGGSA